MREPTTGYKVPRTLVSLWSVCPQPSQISLFLFHVLDFAGQNCFIPTVVTLRWGMIGLVTQFMFFLCFLGSAREHQQRWHRESQMYTYARMYEHPLYIQRTDFYICVYIHILLTSSIPTNTQSLII